uniref:Uncharacterized protein n=1 Tax=Magallana gigas TaxID=29159 RepID=K1S2M9_MAGGI
MAEWKAENPTSIHISKRDDTPLNASTTAGKTEIMNVIRMRLTTFMDFTIRFLVRIFCRSFSSTRSRLEVVLICILYIFQRVRKYRTNVRLRVRA